MARSVYITAIEPGSGKSVVALGMMESLSRLGYFRPIVPSDTPPDNDLFAVSRPMRRAEGLDVSSFAAQDACAAEQPPPAKRSPCRPARQKPRQRIQSKGWRWRPSGVHRMHREWVRREAEVEARVLIDYFLRESLGLTNIVKAIQSTAGSCAVRPVLEEGEPWRKDRSQARPRLRSTPSAR